MNPEDVSPPAHHVTNSMLLHNSDSFSVSNIDVVCVSTAAQMLHLLDFRISQLNLSFVINFKSMGFR